MLKLNNCKYYSAFFLFLMAACLVAAQAGCSSWGTEYSGKDDEQNVITIFLTKYGRFGLGHGGFGREMLEGYMFVLEPIKHEYVDDEISMSRRTPEGLEVIQPVKGSFRFNGDYTMVTINLKTEIGGLSQDFPGNGTYRVDE